MEKLPELSKPNKSSSTTSKDLAQDRALFAAKRAAILFGCYRRGEANDPETYTMGITAILSEYSEEVILHVTDPRTGIARKIKFLPSIPEVDAACMAHADWCAKRDELLRKGWRFECGQWVKPEAA